MSVACIVLRSSLALRVLNLSVLYLVACSASCTSTVVIIVRVLVLCFLKYCVNWGPGTTCYPAGVQMSSHSCQVQRGGELDAWLFSITKHAEPYSVKPYMA
jgi:hypothetical protein